MDTTIQLQGYSVTFDPTIWSHIIAISQPLATEHMLIDFLASLTFVFQIDYRLRVISANWSGH